MPVAKKPVLMLVAIAWGLVSPLASSGQQPSNSAENARSDVATSRDDILQSDRWRQLRHSFDQWLSVQTLYTDDQIKEFKANLDDRIASMSPVELEDFLHDSEERLAILLSNEANDARDYLSLFTPEGIRRRLTGGETPDVFGMTTSQLREELRQFQKQRADRAATSAKLSQQRQRSVDAFMKDQQRRQQAQAKARQSRPSAAYRTTSVKTHYTPRRDPPPKPRFTISPWGGVWRSLP